MVSPIKLMIAEEDKFQGKALSLSHTKTAISTIKEKFSLQLLRRFEESYFGHLLVIEDLKWTSPIAHGLLLRKADPKTVSQVNRIKFIVGNKVIQFTAQQFCVVTRLRFGSLPFIPIATNENCSLKRTYFCNDKTVSLLELEKAFLDCADEDDVFKLGFVYFVVFVLLGSEKHVHIDMRYLKHVTLVFGTHWTTADYCLQQFLESVKGPAKKRGSKKAAASNTVDLPPSNLNNIHNNVRGTWQHGYGQAWTKVRKVYFPYNLQGSH